MRTSPVLLLVPTLLALVIAGCGEDSADDGTSSSSGGSGVSSSSGGSSSSSGGGGGSSSSSGGGGGSSSSSGGGGGSSSSSGGASSSSGGSSSSSGGSSSSSGGASSSGGPALTYSIGGTITGLVGAGLTLHNGPDNETLDGPAATFTFDTEYQTGAPYNVTVTSQPTNPVQLCSLVGQTGASNVGVIDVTTVSVKCETQAFKLGGVVTGLPVGGSVTISSNGQSATITDPANDFTFADTIASNTAYDVKVTAQPAGAFCTIANGAGTMAAAAVENVSVACQPVTSCKDLLDLDANAADGVHSITIGGVASDVLCDMTTDGGGWTLALKASGASAELAYSSAHWTDNSTFGVLEGDTEALLNTYANVMVEGSVRVVMTTAAATQTLLLTAPPSASLQALVTLPAALGAAGAGTMLGRAPWFALVPGSALQQFCNLDGFNVNGGSTLVRIGIVGNENGVNDCSSADSAIGVGIANNCGGVVPSVGNRSCYNPYNVGITAEVAHTTISSFAKVWVR